MPLTVGGICTNSLVVQEWKGLLWRGLVGKMMMTKGKVDLPIQIVGQECVVERVVPGWNSLEDGKRVKRERVVEWQQQQQERQQEVSG